MTRLPICHGVITTDLRHSRSTYDAIDEVVTKSDRVVRSRSGLSDPDSAGLILSHCSNSRYPRSSYYDCCGVNHWASHDKDPLVA